MKDIQLELDFDQSETDAERSHIERFIDIFAGTPIGQSIKDKYETLLAKKEMISEDAFHQEISKLYEEVCESVF